MAKIWYKLIKAGEKELADVPERYRKEVEEMLAADVVITPAAIEKATKKSRK